jgi:two-component system phosphate regulon sensor histidine kinase PhoR
MKRSIFLKIYGGYILIVIILTVVILVYSFETIRNHYLENQASHLEKFGEALKLDVLPLIEKGHFQDLDSLAKTMGKKTGTRITVVDPDGVVRADTEENPEKMESHRYRPEIFQALQGKAGRSIRLSATVRQKMLYVGLPLEKEGKILGVLRVSFFLKDISHLLSSLKIKIIRIAGVISVFLLLVAFFFSRSISKPIQELTRASQKVASGDFNIKIFLKNKDELRGLADSFNSMTLNLKTLFLDLEHQKEELNSIISSIQEGLVVIDKTGKILLSNESFKKISQNDSPQGKFTWEVVRSPKFNELLKKAKEEKRTCFEEILLNRKIYLGSAVYLGSQERIILTLHDITEMKDLERIKKDFVVNVSHELRTPLTAIKGYSETLEGEVSERGQEYLRIITKNTDRLIDIVEDLLVLSGLEDKKSPLEIEEVNLKNLAENILKIFEPRARLKGLTLELRTEGQGLSRILADPFRLEQMLINLLDNALKYTEKGKVSVALIRKENRVVIEVKDTGIGIPEENLPHIFERFYVVDKSRARTLGGTGLGLSIVKHIVLLHKGTISVNSRPGEGTTFTITLPVSPS